MLIDITHELNKESVVYPGNPDFVMRQAKSVENGDSCNIAEITIGSHMGTHIDAPLHFFENGQGIDKIPLEKINGKSKLIEVKGNSIDIKFLKSLKIEKDDRLIFKTDNTKNFNGRQILPDYVTLDYEGAEYLSEKQINMVGIDYMTIELPKDRRHAEKSIHKILLSNNIYILESLDLRTVKEGKYELICMPLKLKNCDGSPVRAVLKTLG